jgi:hypothetical protein
MRGTGKLASIPVADVVAYSRVAGADEERLARLRGFRSDLINPAISARHGRIVKRTGDGSVIEFRGVVDTGRCAIKVQKGALQSPAQSARRKTRAAKLCCGSISKLSISAQCSSRISPSRSTSIRWKSPNRAFALAQVGVAWVRGDPCRLGFSPGRRGSRRGLIFIAGRPFAFRDSGNAPDDFSLERDDCRRLARRNRRRQE